MKKKTSRTGLDVGEGNEEQERKGERLGVEVSRNVYF